MRLVTFALLLSLLVSPAIAADAVTQTFAAPMDRVWSVTEGVLKQTGWDIDKSDRAGGWMTTESRNLDGEDYGVYAKGTRQKLRINMKAAGTNRTAVTIERTVFKRERILWIDKDEPIQVMDQSVEKDLLAMIAKSL
ncbi:MAG TPA: hypothetical protein VGL09_14530 [Methylomirabilota bacterium]|jgi:opacity protein-like surface antigen